MSERAPAAGLVALLLLASLGEGGAAATSLLLWHAGLALLIAAALLGSRASRPRGVAAAPAGAFLLYAAVALAAACVAPYGYAAWLFLLEIACVGAVGWLAARAGPDLLPGASIALLVGAACQSGLALVQRFALDEARPAATFLNPNHLAAWSTAILLLAWAEPLVRRELTRPRATWLALPTALVLAALVATGSRGSFVGLAAGLLVIVRLGVRGWSVRFRRVALVCGLLVIAAAGLGLAVRLREADPFRWQRMRIWTASLRIVADRPWLGTGPRQFADVARAYQFPDRDGPLRYDRGFRSTHSDWLRVPCELGLAGTVAMTGLLVTGLRRARRRGAAPPAGALAALAALGAQAAVENLSTRPAVYLLAAALAGIVLSEVRDRDAAARAPLGVRLSAAALVVAVLAIGEVAPYLGYRAVHASSPDDRPREQEAVLVGLGRNPVHPDYWRRLAEGLSAEGTPWGLERYATAREAAETAVRLNRGGADFEHTLARVEARACRVLFRDGPTRSRAVAAYTRAEALDPFNPFLPLERGVFLLDLGEWNGAAEAATRALELEPDSVRPRLLLAAALLEGGDEGARERARALLAEARVAAERSRSWAATSPYARELLTLDPAAVAGIERGLAAAGATL